MKNSQSFSGIYVDVYNLMNSGKNYESEMQFVLKKYAEFSDTEFPIRILDLGCGLGDHLKFVPEQVHQCVGIDLSVKMIEKAKILNTSDKVSFALSDIGEYSSTVKFQLVFSLFHVLSYQCEFNDLVAYFRTISRVLEIGGVAVVDFWHRPAWELDPPSIRKTQRESSRGRVTRISNPKIDKVHGLAEIDMQIEISVTGEQVLEFSEFHRMRAFTLLELELLAKISGLKILESGDWDGLNSKPLSSTSWYGYVILKKDENANIE